MVVSRKRGSNSLTQNTRIITNEKDHELENRQIVLKISSILRERGVTMWESLLSTSTPTVEKTKMSKDDFLKMLKMMNLDISMREKAILLRVIDPNDSGMIEFNDLLKHFENEEKSSSKSVG
jgi:Ca2+-binding EF-hand superfamily protein